MSFEDDERRFVARMVEKRTAEGWSQREFAKRLQQVGLNWKQQTLARVETDQNPRPLRLSEAAAIASFFGETIESMSAPEGMTAWNIAVRGAAEALLGQELARRHMETVNLEGQFYDSINAHLLAGEPDDRARPRDELPREVRRYLDWLADAPAVQVDIALQDAGTGIYEAAVEESHHIRVESIHTVAKREGSDGSA